MFQYWAFGLHINSEIEFPEMLPGIFEEADVTIKMGKAPEKLDGDNVTRKVKVSASPDEYLLHVNKVASYYVRNGKEIIIDAEASADMNSIRLFMLSNAMAAIVHQRSSIPFHASGVLTKDGLVLFTGRSGIGKSTTALALMQRGYRLFTDDVCVLHYNEGINKIEAVPSYPMMKIWETTLDEIGTEEMARSHKLRPEVPKYGFFQHENFINHAVPVSKIFCLKVDNLKNDFSCKAINKFQAFNLLQQNSYRRGQVAMMQVADLHFNIISKLANQCQVYEITRPIDGQIDSFVNFLKPHLDDVAQT